MQAVFDVARTEAALRRAVNALQDAHNHARRLACKKNVRALAQRVFDARVRLFGARLQVARLKQMERPSAQLSRELERLEEKRADLLRRGVRAILCEFAPGVGPARRSKS